MTVATFPPSVDGYVQDLSAAYATALSGAGTLAASGTGVSTYIGQRYTASQYRLYEGFFRFDTSGLPDAAVVSAASLALYVTTDGSTTNFDITALGGYDVGVSVGTGDWQDGAELGALTNLGALATAGTGAITINGNAAMLAAINLTGFTALVVASSRMGTTPTGDEYIIVGAFENTTASYRPVLSVTYTIPTPAAFTVAASSATSGAVTAKRSAAVTIAATAASSLVATVLAAGGALSAALTGAAASALTAAVTAKRVAGVTIAAESATSAAVTARRVAAMTVGVVSAVAGTITAKRPAVVSIAATTGATATVAAKRVAAMTVAAGSGFTGTVTALRTAAMATAGAVSGVVIDVASGALSPFTAAFQASASAGIAITVTANHVASVTWECASGFYDARIVASLGLVAPGRLRGVSAPGQARGLTMGNAIVRGLESQCERGLESVGASREGR